MKERLENQEFNSQKSTSEIITDIFNLNMQIRDAYSMRDFLPDRYIPQDEWMEIKKMQGLKDQKIIDLLLENRNNPNDRIQIAVKKYKREKTHLFSMNNVLIFAPLTENQEDDFTIRTELTNLRRPGVINNSLEAESILGSALVTTNEAGPDFVHRTNNELMKIRNQIREVKRTGTEKPYSKDKLEELSAQLITERLLPLKLGNHFPPNSSLNFLMYEDTKGKILSEAARLNLGEKVFHYELEGQRLSSIIKELGGYDKIVTIIS